MIINDNKEGRTVKKLLLAGAALLVTANIAAARDITIAQSLRSAQQ